MVAPSRDRRGSGRRTMSLTVKLANSRVQQVSTSSVSKRGYACLLCKLGYKCENLPIGKTSNNKRVGGMKLPGTQFTSTTRRPQRVEKTYGAPTRTVAL